MNEDELFIDPLFIIEWNEAGLQQRGIQKATIINAIRGFQGCQPFPQNAQPRSDSIFYIVDTRNIEAQQIVQNIVDTLQRTYAQREVPTLERVMGIPKENAGRKVFPNRSYGSSRRIGQKIFDGDVIRIWNSISHKLN
ncbi:329_t:CDS:2 [Gigaspora rosea]|nr:329_t:CDS:2 [Gigaspora rosea]